MKLRTQIFGFGLVGALSALLVGGIGLLSAGQQAAALDHMVTATQSVRASMDGDMMHDAIRGDVMAAVLGAQLRDARSLDEAGKSLDEHRARFDASIQSLKAQPLPETLRQPLDAALPLIEQYGAAAREVQTAARRDAASALALMPAFARSFEALETAMEGLGDAIEAHAGALGDAATDAARRTQWSIALALLGALALLAVCAPALTRRITRPLQHAVEVGERIAGGDLGVRVRPQGNAETVRLLESLARLQEGLAAMVHGVRQNAETVAGASAEISAGNHDLSTRTEQQAGSLMQTAASMQQLSATVQRNADNARSADELARGASGIASQGGQAVDEVVQTMKGINESSRRIADITGVIDAIAFQTNILALNAAVEAARAGEQGRGFAVVAGEVRNLAQRSAEAAKEIKALIQASVTRVDEGTRQVDRAGATMHEIVEAIGRVSTIIGEISSASAEQSAGTSLVDEAVRQMDHSTQQNAALVEQSAAAAESLKHQAAQLVSAISQFRLGAVREGAALE